MFTKNFFYKKFPDLMLSFFARYLRIEVEGIENLPKTGPLILLPNHSGFMGFDALLMSYCIRRQYRRIPRILIHKLWFTGRVLEKAAHGWGFLEATYKAGISALKKNNVVMLFPEAEEGNFKPINERYKLREFRQGFVRMAVNSKAPVVPVLVIGAEETHITIGQVKILNQLLPLPVNAFPLPAKWKIKFLKPIQLDDGLDLEDPDQVRVVATQVREQMQTELNSELAERKYIYMDNVL
ncbi:MAG TPA: lysophospholipid acyltransferase family protein [Bdellovibrionota bacterium]